MKKIICVCLSIFGVIAITLVWYFSTTLSAQDCIQYCIDNSKRGAVVFEPVSDPRFSKQYVYWVAGDGDSSNSQEIFIFKQKFWGAVASFNRYEYVASSTQSELALENNDVGSIQFFSVNDENEKENEPTVLFYGSKSDLDVFWFKCTLLVSEKEEYYEGKVLLGNKTWMLRLFDLGNTSGELKREILKLEFYDEEKNLLYSYY